jgi:hypothetical protein
MGPRVAWDWRSAGLVVLRIWLLGRASFLAYFLIDDFRILAQVSLDLVEMHLGWTSLVLQPYRVGVSLLVLLSFADAFVPRKERHLCAF